MATDGVMPVEKPLREEFGHTYAWNWRLRFWYNPQILSGQNPVQIFEPVPGDTLRTSWWVVSPNMVYFSEVTGENAEKRAFSIAAGYITQKK